MAETILCNMCGEREYKGIKKELRRSKRNKKPVRLIIFVIALFLLSGCAGNRKVEKTELRWPDTGIAKLLPASDFQYGKILSESEDYLSMDIYNVSLNDFRDYVDACKKAGFTIDYTSSDSHYSANDKEGNDLYLVYSEKRGEISIILSAPHENNSEPEKEDSKTEEPEQKDDAQTSQEGGETGTDSVIENAEPSDNTEPVGGSETEEVKTEDTGAEGTKEEDTKTEAAENTEFRKWVDAYEEFMNKYVDFMQSYDVSDTAALLQYTQLMKEYAEFADATAKLDEGDYSVDDWAYYMAAYTRILQKLSKVQ